MDDRSPIQIRPIWLIGGGAALVVLGICALISVAVMVGLIWYSNQITDRAVEATAILYQRQTAQAVPPSPRATSAASEPTSLPIFGTLPPPPIFSAVPLSTASIRPDETIRRYYEWVSQGRYDLTWPLLTEAFKQKFNCCAPNYNYAEYVNWWDSVNTVEFGTVTIVSQSGERAVVYAELYYVMNTGAKSSVDRDPYFALIYDPVSGNWRLDDKRGTP